MYIGMRPNSQIFFTAPDTDSKRQVGTRQFKGNKDECLIRVCKLLHTYLMLTHKLLISPLDVLFVM